MSGRVAEPTALAVPQYTTGTLSLSTGKDRPRTLLLSGSSCSIMGELAASLTAIQPESGAGSVPQESDRIMTT
jgi:hypothetical protein